MSGNRPTFGYAAIAVCLLAAVAAIRYFDSASSNGIVGAFGPSNTEKLTEKQDNLVRSKPTPIRQTLPPAQQTLKVTKSSQRIGSSALAVGETEQAQPNADSTQLKIDAPSAVVMDKEPVAPVKPELADVSARPKPQTIQNRFFDSSPQTVVASSDLEEVAETSSRNTSQFVAADKLVEQQIGTTIDSGSAIAVAGPRDEVSFAQTGFQSLDDVVLETEGVDSESTPLSLMDSVDAADRFASMPTVQEKPRFKKFGASLSNEKAQAKEDSEPPKPMQPVILSAANRWKLADGPGLGDRYKDDTPLLDNCSHFVEGAHGNFSPTPTMQGAPYDPCAEMNVYNAKTLNAHQRPILELGRPWYQLGPIPEGSSLLGFHNHINWQYVLFGDFRSGIAANRQNGNSDTLWANQLNLFHHLKITSTERIVAGMTPLNGAQNTRYDFERDEMIFEGDADFDFAFIEADLGAITGGFIGETLPFDLPFAVGIMPLVFQNGVWFEDAILGAAVTIPARNSPRFDISNMDITFFAGYDKIDSPAFQGDDSAARVVGVASFIEALNGYFEIDYAFLDDRTGLDRSYHNFAAAYTRRFGRFLSHSTRIIVNAGQSSAFQDNTADGVLLISENSLITGSPSTVVPYLNMWAGFDRPQSVARAGIAGGILRNTGILFESDNLTGYPTLDATANDTYGMAMGLNLLADEFAQQLIVEMAMLGVMGNDANRNAVGDQYGVGARYQLPLTNSVIFRADAMAGFLRGTDDINGVRMELRKKW